MMHAPRRLPAWAWLVPPVLLAALVFTQAVDVLQWDEWTIWGEMLRKLDAGTFSLPDLAAQQNEQRNLAARLFGLLLMPAFQLNRFAEYGLNILLAGTGMLAAVKLYARTGTAPAPPRVWLIFSAFAFSLMQWETFTFGANSSVAVLPAALWCGLLTASGGAPTPLRLAALSLIGVLPSFSFANGLFYWFALLPVLWDRALRHGTLSRTLGLWGVMTVGAWLLYFAHFQSPGHHPSLLSDLAHPLDLVGYFLAYLGGAVSSDKNLSFLAMALGLGSLPLLTALVLADWRAGGTRRANMLPWLGGALFSLCSAGVTAVARSGFGVEQALESRYASFSTPYWMALFALAFMAWRQRRGATPNRFARPFLACTLGVFLLSSVLSAIVVHNRHDNFMRARRALFTLTDKDALKTLFPDTAYLMMQLPRLMQKRLSVYRDVPVAGKLEILEGTGGYFSLDGSGSAAQGRVPGITVRGTRTKNSGPVLLMAGESVVGYLPEPDTQWRMFLPLANLPGEAARLKAFTGTAQGLLPLAPEQGVPVQRGELPPVDYDYDRYFLIQ